MQVVMVPDPHVSDSLKENATVVYKSLLDFKPEDFGLPPFDDDLKDTPNGCTTAKAAGMHVDPDFKPENFGLPPFKTEN